MTDEHTYQTGLVEDIGSINAAVGMANSYEGDIIEQARADLDPDDADYHAIEDTSPVEAEQYWVEPDAGMVAVQQTDGSVEEYLILAADNNEMAVADSDGCYKAGKTDEGFWVSNDTLSEELVADLYDVATAWDQYQDEQETETAALTIEGNDGRSAAYERVQHQLEQEGEIVFDDGWSQTHSGGKGARGGALGVQTKKMLERKHQAGEIPYEVEGDSSGKHFTLRIRDFEQYDAL